MAFFGVTIEEIEKIFNHPNADRLELVKLKGKGFQFAVRKGIWKENEKCMYFPIDSIIPDDVMLTMGLASKNENGSIEKTLCGPNKNRVKTIRLRKEISQGLIEKIDKLLSNYNGDYSVESITEYLGVIKYEPPIVIDNNANLLPIQWSVYDIEGADRHESVFKKLLGMNVVITEKLEGMNSSFFAYRDGSYKVNQRRYTIEPREGVEHTFWKVAKELGLLNIARSILDQYNAETVGLYGEFVGPNIQKNIYHLKNYEVFVFDIMINGKFINAKQFYELHNKYKFNTVPVLEYNKMLKNILNNESISNYSNGLSKIFKTLREGIVIKPMEESFDDELGGRLILKQRSPNYLAKTDN